MSLAESHAHSKLSRRFEVAVVGAGCAGAAAALTLARAGRQVLWVEARERRLDHTTYRMGEGLPPEAFPLLRRLGLWQAFEAQGHLPCTAHVARWGDGPAHRRHAIDHPLGAGRHLDRSAFDELLWRHAEHSTITRLRPARARVSAINGGDGWALDLSLDRRSGAEDGRLRVSCDFLVDAGGRGSRLGRSLGARRRYFDHLVACHALFTRNDEGTDLDLGTRIEAAACGWWYSAPIPGRRRVVALFCDALDPECRQALRPAGFDGLLNSARLGPRLGRDAYFRGREPRLSPCRTSILSTPAGDGWLAVGDAAAAMDPISSRGLYSALHHGIAAGQAVDRTLKGDTRALDGYREQVREDFDRYLAQRAQVYAGRAAALSGAFWRRRGESQGAVRS